MSYPRHHTIDHYLRKVRMHTEPYEATVLGTQLVIYPMVMSPRYDRSSQIFWNMLPSQAGKRFLDVGCGTGIVGLMAARTGASLVSAVDINPVAVENTRQNFRLHGVENAEVQNSDLFESVDGTYDTVFFNAPFHGNAPEDMLERGTSDENYAMLRRFMQQVGRYLAPDGTIFLGFSDSGDNGLVRDLIRQNGLREIRRHEENNGDWNAYLYELTV